MAKEIGGAQSSHQTKHALNACHNFLQRRMAECKVVDIEIRGALTSFVVRLSNMHKQWKEGRAKIRTSVRSFPYFTRSTT